MSKEMKCHLCGRRQPGVEITLNIFSTADKLYKGWVVVVLCPMCAEVNHLTPIKAEKGEAHGNH